MRGSFSKNDFDNRSKSGTLVLWKEVVMLKDFSVASSASIFKKELSIATHLEDTMILFCCAGIGGSSLILGVNHLGMQHAGKHQEEGLLFDTDGATVS
jgi:ABC-type arginine transport system ATPase subunit